MTLPARPPNLLQSIWRSRSLFLQLCRRDITERYRGSSGGLIWAVVTPLVMLSIYAFVFGVIFNARWGKVSLNRIDYTLLLFAGLLVYSVFSETANRSPLLIASKPNFVKKIVFPLELLPVVAIVNALFHFAMGLAILLVFCLFAYGTLPATALLVPIAMVPVLLFTLGASWLLSSVGVFLHDLRHIVPFVTTGLMFLSPVFYPATAVPENYRFLMWLNPLTASVEGLRAVVVQGEMPNWPVWAVSTVVNGLIAAVCLLWFRRARRHFADVV